MTNLVCGVICSRVFHLNQNVGMEEIGSNHVRHKRCALLLKNCSHNVIPNVPLPLELCVGKIMTCNDLHTDLSLEFNHNYNQKHLLHVSLCKG